MPTEYPTLIRTKMEDEPIETDPYTLVTNQEEALLAARTVWSSDQPEETLPTYVTEIDAAAGMWTVPVPDFFVPDIEASNPPEGHWIDGYPRRYRLDVPGDIHLDRTAE